MSPDDITEAWLVAANERFRQLNIPPKRRPFEALRELSVSQRLSIGLNSPAAEKVFKWFLAHTQPGSHAIGALFTGVFYYDACFWPVTVPVFYGRVQLNAFDALG